MEGGTVPDYGGAAEDHAWYGGELAPGAKLQVFQDRARTSRITDVTDLFTSQPFAEGTVVCNALARFRFRVPDAVATGPVFVSPVGSSVTYQVDPDDTAGRVATLEAEQSSTQDNLAALSGRVDSNETTAGTAHQIATDLQGSVGAAEGVAPLDSGALVPGGNLPAAPLVWSLAGALETDHVSAHPYTNLGGRGQTVPTVRAQAAVTSGEVTCRLLRIDTAGTTSEAAALVLDTTTDTATAAPGAAVAAGEGLTVEVVRGTTSDEVADVTVQVMLR